MSVTKLEAENAELKAQLAAKDAEIKSLKAQLEDACDEIEWRDLEEITND